MSIKDDIEAREYYQRNPTDLYLYLLKELFRILAFFILGVLLLLLSDKKDLNDFVYKISTMPLAYGFGRAIANIFVIRSIRDFENYKKKTLKKIEHLERKLSSTDSKALPKPDE